MYQANEGKVWDFAVPKEDGSHLYGKILYLGVGDSIDNYIQVDEAERDAYYAEQEQKEKEAQFKEMMKDAYPDMYAEMFAEE